MHYIILILAITSSCMAQVAPKSWKPVDKSKKTTRNVEGKEFLTHYKGAWRNADESLGVFVVYNSPNECKTQDDIVDFIIGSVREKASKGYFPTKIESRRGNLGLRICFDAKGKISDEVVLLPSDNGWTYVGLNYLKEKVVHDFDVDQWNLDKLSENKHKEYREVIKWFVGYAPEFIKVLEKQYKQAEQVAAPDR